MVKLVIGDLILNAIRTYTPQLGLSGDVNLCYSNTLYIAS
jgi:hypothetical protein